MPRSGGTCIIPQPNKGDQDDDSAGVGGAPELLFAPMKGKI